MPADAATCKNKLNNLLLCYSGCESNESQDNKYIYCKFYNSSLITKRTVTNNPDDKDLMFADYPQIVSNNKDN